MIGHAGLAADEHARTHHGGTREAGLRRDQRAFSDLHVVTDMHVGVELASAAEQRRAQCSGVDRAQRADLHVVLDHDAAELWNAHPAAHPARA